MLHNGKISFHDLPEQIFSPVFEENFHIPFLKRVVVIFVERKIPSNDVSQLKQEEMD